MGYNLAIEYLADYEKTWMLDSFRALNAHVLVPQQRGLSEWLFLEVACWVLIPIYQAHSDVPQCCGICYMFHIISHVGVRCMMIAPVSTAGI